MRKYVIDTHALIWFLEGNSRLGKQAKTILSQATNQLIIPAIVLAEASWIVERGRTSIPSVTSLLSAIKIDPRITVYPLNEIVIEKSNELLTIQEMHDRQIVAMVKVLEKQGGDVILLTCDQNITQSKLVQVIW